MPFLHYYIGFYLLYNAEPLHLFEPRHWYLYYVNFCLLAICDTISKFVINDYTISTNNIVIIPFQALLHCFDNDRLQIMLRIMYEIVE